MSRVLGKTVTAEEFFDFVHQPENRDRVFELQDGEIVEMSRPGEVLDENEELTGYGVLPDFRCQVGEFFTIAGKK